jgi:hypothetical protein
VLTEPADHGEIKSKNRFVGIYGHRGRMKSLILADFSKLGICSSLLWAYIGHTFRFWKFSNKKNYRKLNF